MDAPTDADSTAGAPPPPGPPAGRPGPRRLQRRPDDGHIAGVCAGVAEYFNVDPVIVRIAAVVLLFSGPGAFAYVLAWIFVPAAKGPIDHGAAQRPIDRMDRGTQIFGIVLLFLAGSLFWGDWWSPAKRWLFPLGLMALGGWLLLRRDRDEDDDAHPVEPAAPTPPSAWAPTASALTAPAPLGSDDDPVPHEGDEPTTTDVLAADEVATDATDTTDTTTVSDPLAAPEVAAAGGEGGEPPPPPWWTPPRPGDPHGIHHAGRPDHLHHRRGRHRRLLGPIMSGALLIWTGLAFLTDVSLETGLAGATLILGLGFVLGSFVGGSRGLIVPALVVATALALTAVIDIPLSGPIGTRTWTPQRIADVEDTYEISMGKGTLDLSAIAIREGTTLSVDASVGMGHLVVLLPEAMTAEITTDVGAGESRVFGVVQDGLGVSTDQRYDGASGSGTLELFLQVGMGEVEVERSPGGGAPVTPATTTTTLG